MRNRVHVQVIVDQGPDEAGHPARAGHPGRAGPAAAAEHRLHAQDKLSRAERLGDVVVRPDLETEDAVHLLAARGEHQHREPGLLPT